MHSTKTGLAVYIVVALVVTLSSAKGSVKDLVGSYEGPIVFPTVISIDTEGVKGNRCLREYSEECLASIPYGIQTINITKKTISFNYIRSLGVKTAETSKETYPKCVEGGLYPVEAVTPIPECRIQNYDPNTGHLTFIDHRRPDDINCISVKLEEGPYGKFLTSKYVITAADMTEEEVFKRGPSLRCFVYNELCVTVTTTKGNFVSFNSVESKLPVKTETPSMDSKHATT